MAVNRAKILAYAKMGQKGAVSGVAMPTIAQQDEKMRIAVADSVWNSSLTRFSRRYPERIINTGIAEQNLISVACGISSIDGRCVFATTYSAFLIVRALEQIRQNLSYQQFNVKLMGICSGFTMGTLGVSHWATEDLAFTRILPGMTVLSAADSLQAVKMAFAAHLWNGPVYIRLSGNVDCPVVYEADFDYQIGKAITLHEGKDAAIIATGLMVREALDAVILLEQQGIRCTVIDMHTIQPLDKEYLKQIYQEYPLVITVEEHNIFGGLGSAVAEHMSEYRNSPRQIMIGMKGSFEKLGSQRYVWEQYGMTAKQIARKIKEELENVL